MAYLRVWMTAVGGGLCPAPPPPPRPPYLNVWIRY